MLFRAGLTLASLVMLSILNSSLEGEITVSRKAGKNQVEVSSHIEGIDSGLHNLKHTEKSKVPDFNLIMFRLLGINGSAFKCTLYTRTSDRD